MSTYTIVESNKAFLELRDLIDFYCSIDNRLGEKLVEDYNSTINKLSQSPLSYFNISEQLRRIPLSRFMCVIIYNISGFVITVVGIKDTRIRPDKFFK